MRCTDDASAICGRRGRYGEILKIGNIVPHGGCNSGVISVAVLLCLKNCATLLDIRSYVQGMSLCAMTVK